MKTGMVLFLTLVLTAAMAVTTANAQQYVHTDTLTHARPVRAIAFKDNRTLISGAGFDLRDWDVTTGMQLWEKTTAIPGIYAVALSSHDPQLIAAGGDHFYYVQTFYSDKRGWRGSGKGHTDRVNSLTFKPNSYLLASGSDDETIRIWNMNFSSGARSAERTLRGHTGRVWSVAWSPDGRTLASASQDGTVRLWNPDNGINFAVLRGHTASVFCVAWSPDGRILASGSADDTIRLWNPDTHGIRRVLRGHTDIILSLAFHPDGQMLASGGVDNTIRLWNPNTGAHKATLTGFSSELTDGLLAFSPNGQILAGRGPGRLDISLYRLLTVDVTGNGKVNVNDLVEVASNYGKTVGGGANRKADVNNDGKVDVDDILAVIAAVDAAGAPAIAQEDIEPGSLQASDVQRWIRDAKAVNADSAGIAALERLLAALTHVEAPPKKTVLLANYPNPFNPETWIPYQLSEAAEVTVTIHSSDGKLVRTLELGQMPAGAYSDKDRAAYWDGQNAQGEPVASGIYFYTLTAGDFKATRKMVIRK